MSTLEIARCSKKCLKSAYFSTARWPNCVSDCLNPFNANLLRNFYLEMSSHMRTGNDVANEFVYYLFIRSSRMAPTLYYMPPSPPCRSILLLAKMLEIDLDLKLINILEGENLKQDFVEINPQHCIPTLADGDLVIWERCLQCNCFRFIFRTSVLISKSRIPFI